MTKDNDNIKDLENKLWEAADKLRANSPLQLNEFAEPVLGLIFLKFADIRFTKARKEIEKENEKRRKGASVGRDKPITHYHYQEKGVLYIPEEASFSYLISLPEDANLGKKLNNAMKAIETENNELSGILPKTYQQLDNHTVIALLKTFNSIPDDIKGDTFGQIYEYFLGKFALSDGRGGGEFFTPTSIVKLIVEIIEPYHGRVYDPACGSGGMFVQSHKFVKQHLENGAQKKATQKIAIYGQEKTEKTVRIAKMNLAIHGLSGDIRQGNTYYDDMHKSVGKFDFTMANPPFNVKGIDYERIKDDPRFPYGLPKMGNKGTDKGNYVWIQHFWSSLNKSGRAGFVMANAASDAGHSEKEIRKKFIKNRVVDVIISVGPNMFYNVTLPVTLWFFDNGKKKTDRKNKILFIDAREIYYQIDSAHRKFTDEQIDKIAGIARSYREESGAKKYKDIKGLCKVATLEEVEKAGWSLNPGRYVGVEEKENDDGDFGEKINELSEEFQDLTQESHELEKEILGNLKKISF